MKKSPRQFGSYAKLEAANILLIPVAAYILAPPRAPLELGAMLVAALAAATGLLVGACYWRGVDRRLSGRGTADLEKAVRFADKAEKPLLALSAVAVCAVFAAAIVQGWSRPVIAAAILALLAVLEYVNYYHRQLQHFDNLADFRRLLRGGGLKRSHLARDLAAYRRR